MSIIAKQPEKKEREIIPAGNHPAYLYRVIYLGTQAKEFDGKVIQNQKIWIDFELPKQIHDYEDKETGEKKQYVSTIGAEYTLSLSEKGKLLPLIQGWLGRNLSRDELQSFDICSLLGKGAFLSVVHTTAKTGKVYANIGSIAPVMEGYSMPDRVNPTIEIGKSDWGTESFNELPKFLQDKIRESNEWKLSSPTADDEIPIIDIENMM